MLPDNGYKTGYQLLHGTNRTVGGFKIAGKILKRTRNCFSGEMRYSWNDIIDPNPKSLSTNKLILIAPCAILSSRKNNGGKHGNDKAENMGNNG